MSNASKLPGILPFFSLSPECSSSRLIYFLYFLLYSTMGRLFWEPWRKAVYSQNHQSTRSCSRSIPKCPANGSHQSVKETPRDTLSTLHWASADGKKGSSLLKEHSDQGFPTKTSQKIHIQVWGYLRRGTHWWPFFKKTVESPNCEEHHSWSISNEKL